MSTRAALLLEFHENLKHGNLAPAWAAHSQHGYGDPTLLFTPPFAFYVSELFYVLFGNTELALQATALALSVLGGSGMFALALVALEKQPRLTRVWGASTAALGYVLGIYLFAHAELSSMALLPWLTVAWVRLSRHPTRGSLLLSAIASAAFITSHNSLAIMFSVFPLVGLLAFRKEIKKISFLVSALILSLGLSAFFWLSAFTERHFVQNRLPLAEQLTDSYLRLDQIFRLSGALALLGMTLTLWNWALKKRIPRLNALLALACGLCVYFAHRTSAIWYEALTPFVVVENPWFCVLFLIFLGTILGLLSLGSLLHRWWHWSLLTLFIAATGYTQHRFAPLHVSNAAKSFLPALVLKAPASPAAAIVEFAHGRGEASCQRQGPTRIECQIMAITNAIVRVNALDYPQWEALLNGKTKLTVKSDRVTGTLLLDIPPGKHALVCNLRNSAARFTAKLISFFSLLVACVLLFQNQFVKPHAFFPKRTKRLAP